MSAFDNMLAAQFRESTAVIADAIQAGQFGTSTHFAFSWNRKRRQWVASATTATADDEAPVTLFIVKEKT